jgi:FkbM family methyltransferase
MDKPWDEPLPQSELDRFATLGNMDVVFDVGARTSLDYLAVRPNAEYHLFEPYPPFYEWLLQATKDMPNVHVNGYALGDTDGELGYSLRLQSFMDGGEQKLPVKTLDWYTKENNITHIDFLKIDTEKWDYKVLQGGRETIPTCRYIQYETWDAPENAIMYDLLKDHFDCEDIGLRNMFCTRKVGITPH